MRIMDSLRDLLLFLCGRSSVSEHRAIAGYSGLRRTTLRGKSPSGRWRLWVSLFHALPIAESRTRDACRPPYLLLWVFLRDVTKALFVFDSTQGQRGRNLDSAISR